MSPLDNNSSSSPGAQIEDREEAKLTLVSLFAGAGGVDIGFEATGFFKTVVAADWADYSIDTLKTNQSKFHRLNLDDIAPWLSGDSRASSIAKKHSLLKDTAILQADLSSDGASKIRHLYGGPVDLVAGGPPCQPTRSRCDCQAG